jgi:hypothetical protein
MENKIGDEIEFKHLLSTKSFKGKIVDEYEGSNWIVDCGGKDKMVVVRKNDNSIKSLKESKIDKLVRFMLNESATERLVNFMLNESVQPKADTRNIEEMRNDYLMGIDDAYESQFYKRYQE